MLELQDHYFIDYSKANVSTVCFFWLYNDVDLLMVGRSILAHIQF